MINKQQNRISEVDSYDLINQILIIFASFLLVFHLEILFRKVDL